MSVVVKCGDAMWNDGVVHGEYQWCAGCKMWNGCGCGIPSNVEWFDAILDMVVWCRNDGWTAVWDVWCGLECKLWDGGMCSLYLNVMCMTWCEVECGRDVEWCAEMWWWFGVNYGGCEMWCDWCGMLPQTWCDWNAAKTVWCGIWRDVECGVLVCGMLRNARCGKLYGGPRRDVLRH